jgi:drug/metabolite transporter (DMT)-like permease
MMSHTNTVKAYVYAFLFSLIIGFSFMFVKIALQYTNPLTLLAHRFTISFAVLFLANKLGLIKASLKFNHLAAILPLSLFYPISFFLLQTFGLLYISSGEAGIIQATSPLFTLGLAMIFLKEKITPFQSISILISVSGVIYIFANRGIQISSFSFLGTLLIGGSAFSSACYNVMTKIKLKDFKIIELSYAMMLTGFVVFNTAAILYGFYTNTLNHFFDPYLHPTSLLATLYLGLFSSLGTSLLTSNMVSILGAAKVGVFSNLGTVITLMAGVFFLGETFTIYHFIGSVLVLLGVIGANRGHRKS